MTAQTAHQDSAAAPGQSTARLEAFSDGVFAVAITLLVLDLRDPGGSLAAGLGKMCLLLLMFVTVIPFPTGLLADHLRSGADEHVAAAVYAGTLLAMSIAFFSTYLWAAHKRLFGSWVADQHVGYLLRRNVAGLFVYAAAIAVAFANATVSLVLCGLVALYYLYPGRALRAP
jgi:uncharacterized membrane protein